MSCRAERGSEFPDPGAPDRLEHLRPHRTVVLLVTLLGAGPEPGVEADLHSGRDSHGELTPEPALAARDVGCRRRPSELGVTGHDRFQHAAMLFARLVEGALGLTAVPQPCPHRAGA